jgi:hypothetical protein
MTVMQAELLMAWGCSDAQSFYYAQPLTPEELAPLLRSGGIVVPHGNRNAASRHWSARREMAIAKALKSDRRL